MYIGLPPYSWAIHKFTYLFPKDMFLFQRLLNKIFYLGLARQYMSLPSANTKTKQHCIDNYVLVKILVPIHVSHAQQKGYILSTFIMIYTNMQTIIFYYAIPKDGYHRFIAGPTLNNSKTKVNFFGNYHLMLLKM